MVTGDQDHETAVHWLSEYSGGVVVVLQKEIASLRALLLLAVPQRQLA
jgi:hypothetical protein